MSPFGDAEVQRADRLRISRGDFGEWAAAEHELDSAPPPGAGRAETPAVISSCSSRSAGSPALAIGAAMTGLRPVVEIMTINFRARGRLRPDQGIR